MRFCRFRQEGKDQYGKIIGEEVVPLHAPPWSDGQPFGKRQQLRQVELLFPSDASKVIAVGLNYRKHAEEMKKAIPEEPLLFFKPPTALNSPGQPILLPRESQEIHHEAELALVIGARLYHASEKEAAAGIFGLTCFNDVTARDFQRRDVQYTRAKGFDTFAPAGPWIQAGLSWADLRILCRVNGQVRQDGRTSDMIFSPPRLVSFISSVMTLLPGDLVVTGTPPGVGRLVAGDQVEVEIEGIGTLANPVQMGS
jgi:2-keto-4-pentenoate hydratase/2-oxohepta-3-ene-1,7-dioic acid hydratase in catechol pathway